MSETDGIFEVARASFGLFRRLDGATLRLLRDRSAVVRVESGKELFSPGDACEGLGFMVEGSVKVALVNEQGRELVLYRVRPGESCTITISCLISGSLYPAHGVVEEDLTALAVPRAVFTELLERSPEFRTFVLEIFSARLTHLMELVQEVAFNKLDQRLAARLLALGPVVEMSHDELARELGTSREIVSRILESFADEGTVELGRRLVCVRSPEALERRRA